MNKRIRQHETGDTFKDSDKNDADFEYKRNMTSKREAGFKRHLTDKVVKVKKTACMCGYVKKHEGVLISIDYIAISTF